MKTMKRTLKGAAAATTAAAALLTFAGSAHAGRYSATIEQLCDGTAEVTVWADVFEGQDPADWVVDVTVNGVLVRDNGPLGATVTTNIGAVSEATVIVEFQAAGVSVEDPKPPIQLRADPPTNCEPETTIPETTVPETTVPETTVPETTVPETTVPETTVPETSDVRSDVPTPTVLDASIEAKELPATGASSTGLLIAATVCSLAGVALLLVRRRPA